jgi:hypothetical protein
MSEMIPLYWLEFVGLFVNEDFPPMLMILVQVHLSTKKKTLELELLNLDILHFARTPITHQTAVTIESPWKKQELS